MLSIEKTLFFISALLITFGCQCDKYDTPCNAYTREKAQIKITTTDVTIQYSTGDTLTFDMNFTDTITDINGNNGKETDLRSLTLYVEIFRIVYPNNSSIPNLQPVFTDFNPLVTEGQILIPAYYGRAIQYRFKREFTRNILKAGLECGRKGTYLIRFSFSGNAGETTIYPISEKNNACFQFLVTPLYTGNQNIDFFNGISATFLPITPGFDGFTGVDKSEKTYRIITVN